MSGASRVTFIAAVPGWDVVLPVTDATSHEVCGLYAQPVVAWQVTSEDRGDLHERPLVFVLPVTVENEDWERVNFAVRQPDGRLFIPEMQDFATDDDLIVYFAEEERSARNRIAKKSAGS